jgi:hypothetical protein
MTTACIKFGRPGDLDNFALGVVVDTGKPYGAYALQHWAPFHEPSTATHLDEFAGLGER